MHDPSRKNQELIDENYALKQRIKELEQSDAERKRTEEALQASENRLREIATQIPGVVYQYYVMPNGATGFYYISDRSEQVIGLKPDLEGYFERFSAVVIPEHRDSFIKSIEKSVKEASEWKYEGMLQKPSGEIIWFSGNSTPSLREDEIVFNGIVIDISARKRAEERFRLLVKNSSDITGIVDPDGKQRYVSDSAERITGFPASELASKNLSEVIHPDDLLMVLEAFQGCLAHPDKLLRAEYRHIHKTEGWVYVEAIGQSFIDDPNIRGVITNVRDITERKRVEERLQQAHDKLEQRVAERTEELRQANEKLLTDITERKQMEEALRIQNKTFSQVLNSLDALVYVVDMKTYEIVFINTYGQNIWGDITGKICWQTIQTGQAAPCEFCTNSKLIGPDGNPTEGVVWEFQNTVNKQWYACRDRAIHWPDGRIVRMEIATDFTFRKQAEEALEKERRRLQQLLDEVRTLRGIVPICANCKKIRDDEGFWNQVEKYVSDRTEAEFSHGICPECAQKLYPDINKKTKIKVTGRPVVLLVDDEEDFRMIFIRQIKQILKDQELEFIEASDGEEALELLKGGAKPSIIILDYAMPKINGMEFLRRIDRDHNDLYDVPRIMISGYAQKEIISEAQSLRCVFFEKDMDNIFYQQICQYMTNILVDLTHKKKGV
ncbi:MAG: PAS domain S-box protein [Syntrophales bacterium]|jgi:PAS domain S-box-containing protein